MSDDIWTRFSSGFSCFLRLEAGLHQDLEVLEQVGTNLVDIWAGDKEGRLWELTDETFSHICCQITAELDSINAGQGVRLQCEEKITLTTSGLDICMIIHSHLQTMVRFVSMLLLPA